VRALGSERREAVRSLPAVGKNRIKLSFGRTASAKYLCCNYDRPGEESGTLGKLLALFVPDKRPTVARTFKVKITSSIPGDRVNAVENAAQVHV
jgi:hypothetical protein